ncbi:MAG TPA: hypothetical protein VIL11_00645 [Limnochordales bacterium]
MRAGLAVLLAVACWAGWALTGHAGQAVQVELAPGARAAILPPEVVAEGGVTARLRDTTVRARRLRYDDRQRVAVFEGDVELEQPGRLVRGERLTYRLDEDRAEMEQATVQEQAPGLGLTVNARTPRVVATPQRLVAEGAELTTCPLPLEHAQYRVRVRRLEVEPGRWVRAWHAVVYDSGVPIFYWPYLQFSLTNPRSGRFSPPEVGYGNREGWYVRFRVPYQGPGPTRYGYLLANYYERLGPGLGVYQALYDDGTNWLAVMAQGTANRAGRVPDLLLGVEAAARPQGEGSLQLQAAASQKDELGTVRQEGRLSARGDVAAWGLASQLDALVSASDPGAPGVDGTWVAGRLQLDPPGSRTWKLQARGRWDVNTVDLLTPRVLWDLDGRVEYRPQDQQGRPARWALWAAAGHQTNPDLFGDPAGQWPVAPWVAQERLPEVGLDLSAWQGTAGEVPVALVATVSAGRVRELVRDSSAPAGSQRPIGAAGLVAVEDVRFALRPALRVGPTGGPERAQGEVALWTAAYAGGHSQAAATVSLSAEPVSTGSTHLRLSYQLNRPLWQAPKGPSPFQHDRVQSEQLLGARAEVGRGRPAGAWVQASYLLSQGRWKEVAAQAELGRGGPWSAGLFALYQPDLGGWRWAVGWGDARLGGVRAGMAARLLLGPGTVDHVAVRLVAPLGSSASVAAGADANPASGGWLRYDFKLQLRMTADWVVAGTVRFDQALGGLQQAELALVWDQDCRSIALRYDSAQRSVGVLYQVRGFAQPLVGVAVREGDELYQDPSWQAHLERLRTSL